MVYKFIICFIIILSQHSTFAKTKKLIETNVEPNQENQLKTHKISNSVVESYLSKLSLRQKVGQLFVFGFSGKSFNYSLKRRLKRLQPGSIIIFKRNIKNLQQIASLNSKIHHYSQQTSGLPALIMVDQEGGSVTRIKTRPNPPSAMAIGELNNTKLSQDYGYMTGQILSLLHFNMNLAPVTDLSSPGENSFIGNRSFGSDPQGSARLAQAYGKGLLYAGILPTFKHFPGHGGVSDSHKSTPQSAKTFKDLNATDLIPYKEISKSNAPSAIMVAHVAFPKIDPSRMPATFSKKLIQGILKDHLKYQGLILTDDLEMYGAEHVGSVGERAVKAIQAGSDLIMVAWSWKNQKLAYDAVYKAVQQGLISTERIDQSLKKIITTKLKLNAQRRPSHLASFSQKVLKKKIHKLKQFTHSISHNIIHSNPLEALNLKNISSRMPTLIVSADRKFYSSFKKIKKRQTYFLRISRKKKLTFKHWLKRHPDLQIYFYVTGQGSARKLKTLPQEIKKRIVIVNSLHPGAISNKEQFKATINIYSRNYLVGKWLAEFITSKPRASHKKIKSVQVPRNTSSLNF